MTSAGDRPSTSIAVMTSRALDMVVHRLTVRDDLRLQSGMSRDTCPVCLEPRHVVSQDIADARTHELWFGRSSFAGWTGWSAGGLVVLAGDRGSGRGAARRWRRG